MLKYSEEQRRQNILSAGTISAYLPVLFWRGNVYELSKDLSAAGRDVQMKPFTRVGIFQSLHESAIAVRDDLSLSVTSSFDCVNVHVMKFFFIPYYRLILNSFQNAKTSLL